MKKGIFLVLLLVGAQALSEDKKEIKEAAKPSSKERYEGLSLFNKVLYFVEQNYVEEVNDSKLINGALKGMLETLDPHSNVLTGDNYKDMKADTSGKFGGLGIELTVKDTVLTVVTPIDDTPAHKAGVKAGDRIVKINGEGTKGLSISDAIGKMRGKKGTDITLTVWRQGLTTPKDIVIRRGDVKIQVVKHEVLEPHYLYTRLTTFNENAAKDLKKAMDDFEGKNASKGLMKGLILDLRNNPGGLLDQAVAVSSLFIDDGVIVSTRGRTEDAGEVKRAIPGTARTYMPVAVLVNGASASAAEIVAGALQDHKRAVIMGQPTFGKGSVQTVVEINPEMGLKLTIARYFTPSGRSIQAKGIVPDVSLDDIDQKVLAEATRKNQYRHEKDLDRHIENNEDHDFSAEDLVSLGREPAAAAPAEEADEPKPFVAKEDYQVKQALNYMKSFTVLRAMKLGPLAEPGTKKAESE